MGHHSNIKNVRTVYSQYICKYRTHRKVAEREKEYTPFKYITVFDLTKNY
jgi:hypothetical protein